MVVKRLAEVTVAAPPAGKALTAINPSISAEVNRVITAVFANPALAGSAVSARRAFLDRTVASMSTNARRILVKAVPPASMALAVTRASVPRVDMEHAVKFVSNKSHTF